MLHFLVEVFISCVICGVAAYYLFLHRTRLDEDIEDHAPGSFSPYSPVNFGAAPTPPPLHTPRSCRPLLRGRHGAVHMAAVSRGGCATSHRSSRPVCLDWNGCCRREEKKQQQQQKEDTHGSCHDADDEAPGGAVDDRSGWEGTLYPPGPGAGPLRRLMAPLVCFVIKHRVARGWWGGGAGWSPRPPPRPGGACWGGGGAGGASSRTAAESRRDVCVEPWRRSIESDGVIYRQEDGDACRGGSTMQRRRDGVRWVNALLRFVVWWGLGDGGAERGVWERRWESRVRRVVRGVNDAAASAWASSARRPSRRRAAPVLALMETTLDAKRRRRRRRTRGGMGLPTSASWMPRGGEGAHELVRGWDVHKRSRTEDQTTTQEAHMRRCHHPTRQDRRPSWDRVDSHHSHRVGGHTINRDDTNNTTPQHRHTHRPTAIHHHTKYSHTISTHHHHHHQHSMSYHGVTDYSEEANASWHGPPSLGSNETHAETRTHRCYRPSRRGMDVMQEKCPLRSSSSSSSNAARSHDPTSSPPHPFIRRPDSRVLVPLLERVGALLPQLTGPIVSTERSYAAPGAHHTAPNPRAQSVPPWPMLSGTLRCFALPIVYDPEYGFRVRLRCTLPLLWMLPAELAIPADVLTLHGVITVRSLSFVGIVHGAFCGSVVELCFPTAPTLRVKVSFVSSEEAGSGSGSASASASAACSSSSSSSVPRGACRDEEWCGVHEDSRGEASEDDYAAVGGTCGMAQPPPPPPPCHAAPCGHSPHTPSTRDTDSAVMDGAEQRRRCVCQANATIPARTVATHCRAKTRQLVVHALRRAVQSMTYPRVLHGSLDLSCLTTRSSTTGDGRKDGTSGGGASRSTAAGSSAWMRWSRATATLPCDAFSVDDPW